MNAASGYPTRGGRSLYPVELLAPYQFRMQFPRDSFKI